MSVRAHRVEKIEYAEESFNLWHDKDITDYLADEGLLGQLDVDMSGFVVVSTEDLKKMLTITKYECTRTALQNDIKWAEEHNQDTVLYYCF